MIRVESHLGLYTSSMPHWMSPDYSISQPFSIRTPVQQHQTTGKSKGQNSLLEYGVVELNTPIQSLSWWLHQKPCFWGKAHRRMSDFPSSAAKRQDHRRMRELHESLRFWEIWMQLRARATIGEFILAPMLGPKHRTLSPPSELDHNSRAMRSFAAQTSPGWIPLCCCSSCTWPNSNFFLNCSTS